MRSAGRPSWCGWRVAPLNWRMWAISSSCGIVHVPLDIRVVGVGPGCSICPGGGVGGRVVPIKRKASKSASPPRMMRICVGPCWEGANCTLLLVCGGRRSEDLGLSLGRLVAVAACMRGVGTPTSRLVIEVMTKPCACCVCASWRVQFSGFHWTRNFSTLVDLLLFLCGERCNVLKQD